jgi:hypothetical protein
MFIIIYRLYVHIILTLVIYIAICVLKIFTLWLGLRFKVLMVLRIQNVVHDLLTLCIYNSYTCNLFCSLYAEDVCFLGRLKIEMPLVLSIDNDVHHHLRIYVYIILKLVICIAIHMLRKSLHWLGLWHHHIWFMAIKVLPEHFSMENSQYIPENCHPVTIYVCRLFSK